MPTTVELISPTDTVTFYHVPEGEGFVYNNATLDAWYAMPEVDAPTSKRPNAHGAYGLGQTSTNEHRPIVNGQYYGQTPADALAARTRLNALYNDGQPITMRVTDDLDTTTREVWVLDVDTTFHYDHAHFPLDIVLVAVDPRRYGSEYTETAEMPQASGGLHWDLGTAPSGLFWDWGDAGTLGQVTFTNTGNATTYPRLEIGGAGGFAAGFRVTELETGRELTLARPVSPGEVIVLDSRTERATVGGNGAGDVTIFMTSRDWFEVPAGATRRYQIAPLGSVVDAPTMTIYAAPASM